MRACFDLVCRHVCVCLIKGARTITRIRTIAFLHIMCVLCVYLCIPVHTCVVHAWVLTGYNVLQCYKKRVTRNLVNIYCVAATATAVLSLLV